MAATRPLLLVEFRVAKSFPGVKALDGVTTALEMEIGVPDVAQFLKAKEGHSLIPYGTSASTP